MVDVNVAYWILFIFPFSKRIAFSLNLAYIEWLRSCSDSVVFERYVTIVIENICEQKQQSLVYIVRCMCASFLKLSGLYESIGLSPNLSLLPISIDFVKSSWFIVHGNNRRFVMQFFF